MKYPIPQQMQQGMQFPVSQTQSPQAARQQGPSMMQRLGNNSDMFLQLGAGLLSGRTAPEQFALGAQGFAQAGKDRKQKADEKQRQNMTMKFLQERDLSLIHI